MKESYSRSGKPTSMEKRGPFGCLIIKKKAESGNSGGGGGGGTLVKRKGFETKERKRPKLILSDSEESEEDLLLSTSGARRNLISSANSGASTVNLLNSFEHGEEIEIDKKMGRLEFEEDIRMGKNRVGLEGGVERKRGWADLFEHSEGQGVELDNKKVLKKVRLGEDGSAVGRIGLYSSKLLVPCGKQREHEFGHSRSVPDFKRMHSDFESQKENGEMDYMDRQMMMHGRSALSVKREHLDYEKGKRLSTERNGEADYAERHRMMHNQSVPTVKREHYEFERNEVDYTVRQQMTRKDGSFHVLDQREKFGGMQPIRVQGKNGVLKVMVNNRNKLAAAEKFYGPREVEENCQFSRSTDTSNWKAPQPPPFYSEDRSLEKSHSIALEEKNCVNPLKVLSSKHNKIRDGKIRIGDTSSPQDAKDVGIGSSKTEIKKKGEIILTTEPSLPARRKEGEIRRGTGTEKQLLREQIRKMLLDAKWTIDFRPRRNRNYQDAVYISPSGTEYWSIVKAYNALQKHFEDEGSEEMRNVSTSLFTPIPEELISQLTRQTKKKIEREMKMKHKVERGSSRKQAKKKNLKVNVGSSAMGEKMSSYVAEDGKSLKVKIKGSSNVGLNTEDAVESEESTFPSEKASDEDEESLFHGQSNSSGALNKGMQKLTEEKKPSLADDANLLQGRKTKKEHGRALLVRGSKNGLNLDDDDDDFVPYNGKRTVLSWLVDMETVRMSGKVQYMNKKRTQAMLEGWITRDGIHCGCCSKILTVSKFEVHAGSKRSQPFQNIFVDTGVSLLQCQLNAWKKLEKFIQIGLYSIVVNGDDPNDDTCGICGDGGDLICCDGCPSTFHQNCLGIQMLPQGDWHCPNCSCKYCDGGNNGNSSQAEDKTMSPLCACNLCEKKYHRPCSPCSESIVDDSNSLCTSFCSQSCKELFHQLQKLLGVKHELEEGFSWTLIQRSDLNSDASIRGLPQKAECNSKLAVALTVMDECFLPVVDRRSGIKLINNVLFNIRSNISRLNYSGFYTVVLERGDEIMSVASIRIHGTRLAEMPYIGTRHTYRRQGMCRRLLYAIESALVSLNVEKLVIPAISELMHTWTTIFGFKPLKDSHRQEIRHLNMLVFPSTDMLQKPLLENKLNEADMTNFSAMLAVEMNKNHELPAMTDNLGITSSVEDNPLACDEGVGRSCNVNGDGASYLVSNPLDAGHESVPFASKEKSDHDVEFLHEDVDCNRDLEADDKPISHSVSETKYCTEDVPNDTPESNVNAGVEPDPHSLAETSDHHTSNDYQNVVSGNNFQATVNCSEQMKPFLNLNQHTMRKVESAVEASTAVSDASHSDEDVLLTSNESTKQYVCEARLEVPAAGVPDTSNEDHMDNSSNTDTQHQDKSFQVFGQDITSHDSKTTSQPFSTDSDHNSKDSIETLADHNDSGSVQDIHGSAIDANDTVTGACVSEREFAAIEHDPEALREDYVDCASEVVGSGVMMSMGDVDLEVGCACDDHAFSCQNEEATSQRGHDEIRVDNNL